MTILLTHDTLLVSRQNAVSSLFNYKTILYVNLHAYNIYFIINVLPISCVHIGYFLDILLKNDAQNTRSCHVQTHCVCITYLNSASSFNASFAYTK